MVTTKPIFSEEKEVRGIVYQRGEMSLIVLDGWFRLTDPTAGFYSFRKVKGRNHSHAGRMKNIIAFVSLEGSK